MQYYDKTKHSLRVGQLIDIASSNCQNGTLGMVTAQIVEITEPSRIRSISHDPLHPPEPPTIVFQILGKLYVRPDGTVDCYIVRQALKEVGLGENDSGLAGETGLPEPS